MTIKEKILAYLDFKGIKRADFFEAMGIAPSNFKGNAKYSELGGDKIAKILTAYNDLSSDWLLLDRGEMIRNQIENQTSPISNSKLEDKLLELLQEKDKIIREQAEEIGQLRERISVMERRRGVDASDVPNSGIASVG